MLSIITIIITAGINDYFYDLLMPHVTLYIKPMESIHWRKNNKKLKNINI